jgi:hypothetical protein
MKKGINRPEERAVFGFDNDLDLPWWQHLKHFGAGRKAKSSRFDQNHYSCTEFVIGDGA